jgi:hypothetical protein
MVWICLSGGTMAGDWTAKFCGDFQIRVKLVSIGLIVIHRGMKFEADIAFSQPVSHLVSFCVARSDPDEWRQARVLPINPVHSSIINPRDKPTANAG